MLAPCCCADSLLLLLYVTCRFVRRPTGCNVSLSISYEVPEVLAPFANVSSKLLTLKPYVISVHTLDSCTPLLVKPAKCTIDLTRAENRPHQGLQGSTRLEPLLRMSAVVAGGDTPPQG